MFWQRPIRFSELVSRVYPKPVNPNLLQFFGNYRLDRISPLLVEQYKVERLLLVSNASVNRELAALKHCFNKAILWRMVRDNPVRGISFLKEKPRQRWISYTEEERLMSVCDPWLKELVIMALNTGMRSSEILSLTKANLDFDRKVITVFHTKNDEPKSIPMTEAVYNLLKGKTGQGRLFSGDKYRVSKFFRLACQSAGITDCRFHDLRHTFASRLVQSGVDLYRVQLLLGHKSPVMTVRYSHHSIGSLKEAISQLSVS